MTGTGKRRERRVARRFGGRAQPASGALPGFKRDVRSLGEFLMEHKDTKADTYALSARDFAYLQQQCSDPVPAYAVDTATGSFVAVPASLWDGEVTEFITTEYLSIRLGGKDLGKKIKFTKNGVEIMLISAREFKQLVRRVVDV